LPPSKGQIRLALGVVIGLLVALALTIPLTNIQLPRVDAFIPAFETAIVFNDLVTAALLFAQFSIVCRWALLVLASGYLFTALIVIPHMLTFPGLFAPTGLLGAGLQSTVWLYLFWHVGSPLAVIVYALLKDASGTMPQRSPKAVICCSVAVVIAIVCGLTWIATAGDRLLPTLFLDNVRMNQSLASRFTVLMVSLDAGAIALLWLRRRSVLDLWLMVMCCTGLFEVTIAAAPFVSARFTLGWYAGRFYGLIATILVLMVLLSETTALYAILARSTIRRRGAREARQIAMDAMAASIAHEIKQPLAAVVTNANAATRWLASAAPNLDEARAALTRIANDGHRANEVIGSIRSMFKKDMHGRTLLDVNDIVRQVLTMVDIDLQIQQVSSSIDLRERLPQVLADRGQLQQVVLNLITNAIEAMRSVTDRPRLLRITSDILEESSGVLITVEDSGIGIEGKDKDRIFEPFFTTKSAGTGIGLTIIRSIIESHGGIIRVSANNPYGTIFQVALPCRDS
jgi:signal transduction histidine kinase